MAEATGLRNNALPYPVYGAPYGVTFPILDADGDLVTGAASLDSEVSKNGDTFVDCTNEATEIATSSGVYYLLLTAAEMTADVVSVIAKTSTTGAKTTVLTLYPRKLVALASGTCQGANDTGDIQLAAGESDIDDIYSGCLCVAVIDGVTEARLINDYVGSTKVAEIAPAWNTAVPDATDTYTIYLPEGRQKGAATIAAGDLATDAIDADSLKADAVSEIQSGLASAADLATVAGYLDTEIAAILADTNELQTDWANGGRLDLIVDAILADTGTDGVMVAAGSKTGYALTSGERDSIATAVWAAGTRTLTSITGLGIALASKLTKYVQLLARKDVAITTDNATELTEINANGGSGSGGYSNASDSLEAIRDRGDSAWTTGGDSGSGANSVTITVEDSDEAAIVGAKVRVSEVGGSLSYVAVTDGNGEVEFSLDNATWTVTITKPLYAFTPVNLVVNGTEAETYTMTTVSVPVPDDPALCTLAVLCVDQVGEPEEGAIVSAQMVAAPSGEGYAFDREAVEAAADEETGMANLTVVRGATYAVTRGGGPSVEVQIPNDEDVVTIENLLGSEP